MAAPTNLQVVPLSDPANGGAVNLGGMVPTATASAVSVATNTGVISVQGLRIARLTAASVVTAALAPGTAPGQEIVLLNESTSTISLVTSGTAGGLTLVAASALLTSSCQRFVWSEALAVWVKQA